MKDIKKKKLPGNVTWSEWRAFWWNDGLKKWERDPIAYNTKGEALSKAGNCGLEVVAVKVKISVDTRLEA